MKKKPTRCHFVLSFISPLQVAQHVSGNHVPIFRSWRLCGGIATCCQNRLAGSVSIEEFVVLRTPQWTHYLLTGSDSLPAANAQHQHVAITPHSRQLLKMGTWLPETCWATCKGEIKDNTKWHLVGFFSIAHYTWPHHLNMAHCIPSSWILSFVKSIYCQ